MTSMKNREIRFDPSITDISNEKDKISSVNSNTTTETMQKTFLAEEKKDEKEEKPEIRKSFLSTMESKIDEEDDDGEIVRGKKKLCFLRISMIFVLLFIAAIMMITIYAIMDNSEDDTFREKFESASLHLQLACQRNIDLNLYTSYTLAFTYLSLNRDIRKWPNVTLVNLDSYAESLCATTDCREIAFAPIVDNETRLSWEQYATENAELLGSDKLIYPTDNTSWVVSDGIFRTENGQKFYDPGYDAGTIY